jgi:hypothetical protein
MWGRQAFGVPVDEERPFPGRQPFDLPGDMKPAAVWGIGEDEIHLRGNRLIERISTDLTSEPGQFVVNAFADPTFPDPMIERDSEAGWVHNVGLRFDISAAWFWAVIIRTGAR